MTIQTEDYNLKPSGYNNCTKGDEIYIFFVLFLLEVSVSWNYANHANLKICWCTLEESQSLSYCQFMCLDNNYEITKKQNVTTSM